MGSERTVIVGGGGTYRVSERQGWFRVFHFDSRVRGARKTSIGMARSLADAIELVAAHAGEAIVRMDRPFGKGARRGVSGRASMTRGGRCAPPPDCAERQFVPLAAEVLVQDAREQ